MRHCPAKAVALTPPLNRQVTCQSLGDPIGDQNRERRAVLGVANRESARRPSPGGLDLFTGGRLERESLLRNQVVERDLDGGDSLKRLAVMEGDDLEQHPTLRIDLQPVAVGATTELVELKRGRMAARIAPARNRRSGNRLAPGHAAATNHGERQRPQQRRRIQHEPERFPDTAAHLRVILVAGRAVSLIPGPPQLSVAHSHRHRPVDHPRAPREPDHQPARRARPPRAPPKRAPRVAKCDTSPRPIAPEHPLDEVTPRVRPADGRRGPASRARRTQGQD